LILLDAAIFRNELKIELLFARYNMESSVAVEGLLNCLIVCLKEQQWHFNIHAAACWKIHLWQYRMLK
jgi:hypothetical protein